MEYYETWYKGRVEDVRRNLGENHRAFLDKPIVISKYGYCECTPDRTAGDRLGGSGTGPKDEFGEPALVSTAYPWGTAQTRNRSVPSHCREVHGSPAEAAISDVACFR